jgi:hypothetical protein
MSISIHNDKKYPTSFVPSTALAKTVQCDSDYLMVALVDGRLLSVPLAWFPRLQNATPEQRARCEIGARGMSLHWPDIDEDLSVAGLLAGGDKLSM